MSTDKKETEARRAKIREYVAAQHDQWVFDSVRKQHLERQAARKPKPIRSVAKAVRKPAK